MRTISAQLERLLTNPRGRATHVRVKVKDSGGTFRDLTTYVDGVNMVVSAKWHEDVDSNGYAADVELRRNNESFSLSPFQEDSALNHAFNPSSAYAPLLDVGRALLIEWAITPLDVAPVDADWNEGFRGVIDSANLESDPITISCRDQVEAAIDTFIERERVYGYAQASIETPAHGCYVFELQRDYTVGDLIIPTQEKLNGHFYKCTTAGNSSTTEPTIWPATPMDTIVVGTCVFTNYGTTSASAGRALEEALAQILADNLTTPPAVFTPTSPLWEVRWWIQQRQPTWAALKALVDQIGWDLRWKWDNGSSSFRLTLWTPDRDKTFRDRAFGQYDGPPLDGVKRIAISRENIRNKVRVIVSDSADLDPQGNPKRKVVEVEDGESIYSYGKRFMEVAESSTSNIDTSSEATDLANRILSDLSQPIADFSVELPFFPFAELGDLYEYPPNVRHFSVTQKFANVSIEHSVGPQGSTTTLGARGKVAGGYRKWLKKDVRSQGPIDIHAMTLVTADAAPVEAIPIVGGTRIKTDITQVPTRPNMRFEHHLGGSSGFTPDSSTLQCVTEGRDVVIPDQVPGATGYHKVVPFWFNGSRIVRGQPSAALTVVHGRGYAGHLKSEVDWSRFPLNGGFETQFDAAAPPDHWVMDTGTWGTSMGLVTSGLSGAQALEIKTGTSTRLLVSGFFDAIGGARYELEVATKAVSGTGSSRVRVRWYDETFAGLGADSRLVLLRDATDSVGSWKKLSVVAEAPATARFGRIEIDKAGSGDNINIIVDAVRMQLRGDGWHTVGGTGEPAYQHSWAQHGSYALVQFRRESGRCYLKGGLAPGAYGADESDDGGTIFEMPIGYGHNATLTFLVNSAGLVGHVAVVGRKVRAYFGEASHLSLDGISFDMQDE